MENNVILLPAKNEAKSIGRVIDDIRLSGFNNIVVVASGCTDNTTSVASEHGALVLGDAPCGKGRAINYALKRINADKIVMLDADCTYPAKSIPDFILALDHCDVVAGIRQFNANNISTIGRWGNKFISWQARSLYNIPIKDLCTGMWGFKGNAIKNIEIESYGFTLEAELFVYANKKKLAFLQIPIEYYPRIGTCKINRLDHLKIMWYLWTRSLN